MVKNMIVNGKNNFFIHPQMHAGICRCNWPVIDLFAKYQLLTFTDYFLIIASSLLCFLTFRQKKAVCGTQFIQYFIHLIFFNALGKLLPMLICQNYLIN